MNKKNIFLSRKRSKTDNDEINKNEDKDDEICQLKDNLISYENLIDKLKDEKNKIKEENSKLKEELSKYKNKKEKEQNINKFAFANLSIISFNFSANKNEKIELIGLKEIKEAPFINPILQCFLRTELLSKYFLYEYKSSVRHKLSHQYFDLINQIKNKQNNISHENFIEIGNDYKNFINNFLNKMHYELIIKENDSIIKNIFQGKTQLAKINCSKTYNFENTSKYNPNESTISPFYHIDFDIKNIITDDLNNLNNEIELQKCFNIWRKKNMPTDIINYVSNYFRIKTCPKILILILERSDEENIKILFEEKFDVGIYTSFFKKDNQKIIYKLYSIITKIKNENHFVAFCLNYNEQKWYKYDDDKDIVQINNFQEIVNYGIPLILFYNIEK